MSLFDLVLVGLLAFGAYKGFRKGFLLEAIAVLSFVLAIIGGFRLMHWGMSVLSERFDLNGQILPYISFLLIFVSIVIAVNLLGKFLKTILDMTLLGSIDNLAGALLAILKWAFGISILLWLSNSFGISVEGSWTNNSLILPYLLTLAPKVVDLVSEVLPFASDLFDSITELVKSDFTS
ncbi:MAG: CvpA family protein [Bacteroidota bacterium]